MLIVSRFDDRLRKRLRRFSAYHIVDTVDVSPTFPGCKQSRKRVRQAMLEQILMTDLGLTYSYNLNLTCRCSRLALCWWAASGLLIKNKVCQTSQPMSFGTPYFLCIALYTVRYFIMSTKCWCMRVSSLSSG